MKTIRRLTLCALFCVGCIGWGSVRAATPKRVDIQRVTLERQLTWDATLIRVTALDDEGATVTYSGLANYILPTLYDCHYCSMPTSFNTNAFNSFQLDFASGQDRSGVFSFLEGESDPITVPATILRKPAYFTRTGTASFKAKFTFSDITGLVAYDDDVDLVGTYSVEFGHVLAFDGHRIVFHKILYDLRQPENCFRPITRARSSLILDCRVGR
jgi:hypothetical protein